MDKESTRVIAEIRSGIRAIEEDLALYEETNFNSRADAIDFIDFHIIDRIEGLQQKPELKEKLVIQKQRAGQAKHDLEKINAGMFKQLREKIRTGSCTKSAFRAMIRKYLGDYDTAFGPPDTIGYDNLDVFINGLLSSEAIPEPATELSPEMVFYQKTPARIIFRLAELADLKGDDVFFDLGSGLGQATILINLLSGATAKGIEYEPAYCNYAKACAARLNLSPIEFINADARKGDYSEGTVFFLYTPFEGIMLQEILEILKKESQKKTIRIFTYGPCSPQVARQSWLNCVNGDGENPYMLYEFRSVNAPSSQ